VITLLKIPSLICAILLIAGLQAQASVPVTPTPAPTVNELNDMLALRAKLMLEAHAIESDIQKAVNDPTVTSSEIEKLRKKVQDLQNEIIQTFGAIRDEIEKRPEIQEKRKQIQGKETQIEALTQKIDKATGRTP